MNNFSLECVKEFKYLGYTWSSKLAMYKSVANCLTKVQRSYAKLKWLKRSRVISTEVLRQCFFAWLFCLFLFLPSTLQQQLRSKFRAGLRLVYRCHWVSADNLFSLTKEKELDYYVGKYIQKRLNKLYKSDLASSLFVNDISFWNGVKKRKTDGLGHFFQRNRVKKMIKNHKYLLIGWLEFVEKRLDP
jgi:hypothetical protein